ncbi:MAG: serine/threonine-protein kinase [Planctomycetota bacterium]|nr:serine/threonine-protein kinase [Planctomycetota bacterium]
MNPTQPSPEPDSLQDLSDTEAESLGDRIRSVLEEEPSALDPTTLPLSRYTDIQVIDQGGMGLVLRATDPKIGRSVAIKTIRPDRETTAHTLRRFQQEARITGQLEHPNIVPIYDMGQASDGTHFFCMKLVEGESLAQKLQSTRNRITRLRSTHDGTRDLGDFLKACDAMAFAHSRRVIHRDLKPANIMIGAFGEVLVMDWGLSKSLTSNPSVISQPESEQRTPTRNESCDWDSLQTQEGALLGTPIYMSPEQAESNLDAIDTQSDLYSLGAILYEILTLEPPFRTQSTYETLVAVQSGSLIPPRTRTPQARIPADLEAVVLKAMAPDKKNRYPEVSDLAADIRSYLDGQTLTAYRYGLLGILYKWSIRNRRSLAVAITILVLGFLSLLGLRRYESNLQQQQIDETVLQIQSERDAIGSIQDLTTEYPIVDLLSGRSIHESIHQRERRNQTIHQYLSMTRSLDNLMVLDPNHQASRTLRLELGLAIAQMALAGRDYLFAEETFRRLTTFGVSEQRVLDWKKNIEHKRSQLLVWRRKRLVNILADIQRGLFRKDRPANAPSFEDLVAEVLGYQDRQTFLLLTQCLPPLIAKAKGQDGPTLWDVSERDLSRFIGRILPHLHAPGTAKALGPWLDVLQDRKLVVETGIALCKTGDPLAEPYLVRVRDRFGSDSATWTQIERHFGNIPESTSKQTPDSTEGLIDRARLRLARRNVAGAIQDLTLVLDREPDHLRARLLRGESFRLTSQADRATSDYTRCLELDPNCFEAWYGRGMLFSHRADTYQAALADLSRAQELNPRHPGPWNSSGIILAFMGRYDRASPHFQRAIELDPTTVEPRINLGNTLYELGQFQAAIGAFDRALQIDPQFTEAYLGRGTCYLRSNRPHQAIEDFDTAIELQPQLFRGYMLRGNAYLELDQIKKAIHDYRQAIAMNENYAPAHFNLGNTLTETGRFEEAISSLDRAIELKPHHASAHFARGKAHETLNRFDAAEKDYQRHLQILPNSPHREAIEEFRSRRKR